MTHKLDTNELERVQHHMLDFMDMVLRTLPDGILITDESRNIVVVNEAFCAFIGRHWGEVWERSSTTLPLNAT